MGPLCISRVIHDDGSKEVVDKSAIVCKHCATCVVHANSNTTNMSAHLQRHHPSETVGCARRKGRESRVQPLPPAAFKQSYSDELDRAKCITKRVGYFIANDMQPFAVAAGATFSCMIRTL